MLINLLISKKVNLGHIDTLLDKLTFLVAWEIKTGKTSLEIHKVYVGLILKLATTDLWGYDRILWESLKSHLLLITSAKERGVDPSAFLNKLIQALWTNLSMNRGVIWTVLSGDSSPLQTVYFN